MVETVAWVGGGDDGDVVMKVGMTAAVGGVVAAAAAAVDGGDVDGGSEGWIRVVREETMVKMKMVVTMGCWPEFGRRTGGDARKRECVCGG
nr:hypothetical protein [Tanacetum cinerariifolium]